MSAEIAIFVVSIFITNHLLPEARVDTKHFSLTSVNELIKKGLWNSANSMGNALNSGLDILITNLMLSGIEMEQVAIVKTINNLFNVVYYTVAQAFHPAFIQSYSNKNTKFLVKEMKFSMKMCGLISNLAFACFCVLGMEFYKLWIPIRVNGCKLDM